MTAVGAEDAPSPGEQVVHAVWSPGQQVQPFLIFMRSILLIAKVASTLSWVGTELARLCKIALRRAERMEVDWPKKYESYDHIQIHLR